MGLGVRGFGLVAGCARCFSLDVQLPSWLAGSFRSLFVPQVLLIAQHWVLLGGSAAIFSHWERACYGSWCSSTVVLDGGAESRGGGSPC